MCQNENKIKEVYYSLGRRMSLWQLTSDLHTDSAPALPDKAHFLHPTGPVCISHMDVAVIQSA